MRFNLKKQIFFLQKDKSESKLHIISTFIINYNNSKFIIIAIFIKSILLQQSCIT